MQKGSAYYMSVPLTYILGMRSAVFCGDAVAPSRSAPVDR